MMQGVQFIEQYNQHRVRAAGSEGTLEPQNITLCSAINFKAQAAKIQFFGHNL